MKTRAWQWLLALAATLLPAPAFAACTQPSEQPLALVPTGNLACIDFSSAQSTGQPLVVDVGPALVGMRVEGLPGASSSVALFRSQDGSSGKALWRGKLDRQTGAAASPRLLLPAGDYLLAREAGGGRVRAYLSIAAPLPASTVRDDAEFFIGTGTDNAFEVTAEGAKRLFDLTVTTPLGSAPAWARLTGPNGFTIDLRGSNDGGVTGRADLALAPGRYQLALRDDPKVPVLFAATSLAREPDFAVEPNAETSAATALPSSRTVSGRLYQPGGDTDRDRLVFEAQSGAALALTIRKPVGGTLDAAIEDASGKTIFAFPKPAGPEDDGMETFQSGRLALPSGRYWLRLDGRMPPEARYEVRLDPEPLPSSDEEAEPNGTIAYATPFHPGQTLKGSLDAHDDDVVRLDVPQGLAAWTLSATGDGPLTLAYLSPDGEVLSTVRRDKAGPLVLSRLPLAPGAQYFKLQGAGGWTLRAEAVDPSGPDDEIETNDTAESATLLAPDHATRFWMESSGATDMFVLSLATESDVTLSVTLPKSVQAQANWIPFTSGGKGTALAFAAKNGDDTLVSAQWSGRLTAGRHRLVLVSRGGADSPGAISVAIAPPGMVAGGSVVPPGLDVVLAAGQAFEQSFTLPLPGAAPGRIWIPADGWRSRALPGALEITAPAYLQDGQTVPIIALSTDGHAALEIHARTVAGAPAKAKAMEADAQTLFAGALDFALAGLGAKPADAKMAGLFAIGSDGRATRLPRGGIELRLPGEKPVEITGVALTPPAVGEAGERLRSFQIEASTGAGGFVPVLSAEIGPESRPQPFVFPAPIRASALRLIPLARWDGAAGDTVLSRWAVIGPAPQLTAPIDIARAELGGHLVRAPESDGVLLGTERTWPEHKARLLSGGRADPSFIMSFFGNRLARLAEIDLGWADPAEPKEIGRIRVDGSTAGPFGPWTPLGTVTRAAPSLRFATGAEARALRFVIEDPADISGLAFPTLISAIEMPGRSLLSYDAGDSDPNTVSSEMAGGLSEGRERVAFTLAPGERRSFTLDPRKSPDDGRPARSIEIEGRLKGMNPQLDDANGRVIALTPDPGSGQILKADVAGFAPPFRLTLVRPRTALVIAWDTSRSVDAFRQAIATSVLNLTAHLGQAGSPIATMNFVPFGQAAPLLKTFTADPAIARAVVHGFSDPNESSDSEAALLAALEALKQTDLDPAVILLTDGDFPSRKSNAVWRSIAEVQPRIFTLRVPAATNAGAQMLLSDWSAATGGSESIVVDGLDTIAAFAGIAGRLNAPAPGEFRWRIIREAPKPGRVAVTIDTGQKGDALVTAADRPVLVILDASGSMLARLDGRRKIDLAKSLLVDLVGEMEKEDVALGLRVFGLGRRDSCDSSLVLKVAPNNGDRVKPIVETITPQDGARTALGASLAQIPSDLGGQRDAVILLITDGEETCGGDPAREVRALDAAGFHVTVNIIGLDIADSATRQNFEQWAALGHGAYFEARDQTGLRQAIRKALLPGFSLMSGDGSVAATGLVDGPAIEVPAGTYAVRLETDPPRAAGTAMVTEGMDLSITLDADLSPQPR